LSVVSRVN